MSRFSKIVSGLYLVLLTLSSPAWALKTFFANFPIEKQCEKSYDQGFKVFIEGLKNDKISHEYFKKASYNFPNQCQYAFAAGIFDARSAMTQQIIVEYVLEQNAAYSSRIPHKANAAEYIAGFNAETRRIFAERMVKIGAIPQMLNRFKYGTKLYSQVFNQVNKQFLKQAQTELKIVQFGRFIYTAYNQAAYTAYEFQRNNKGQILYIKNSPVMEAGTYMMAVKKNYDGLVDVVTKYMHWEPNNVIGQDSFTYGIAHQAGDERRTGQRSPSIRETKEEAFSAQVVNHIQRAKRLHIKMRAPVKGQTPDIGNYHFMVQEAFFEKQQHQLKTSDQVLKHMAWGVGLAPLIPVGMFLGSAIAANYFVGGLALMGKSATGTVIVGSLASAYNLSALTTLAAMTGVMGLSCANLYERWVANPQSPGLSLSNAFDQIITTVVSSFPLLAITPVASIGTAAFGKTLVVDGLSLFSATGSVIRNWGSQPLRKAMGQLVGLPYTVVKAWANSWLKAGNRSTMIMLFGTNTLVEVGLDIQYREGQGGKHAFFQIDEQGNVGLNENAMFSIGRGMLMGFVTTPIVAIENLVGRILLYRSIDLATGFVTEMTTHYTTGNDFDQRRIEFGAIYGLMNMPAGELSGRIKYLYFKGWSQNWSLANGGRIDAKSPFIYVGLIFMFDFAKKLVYNYQLETPKLFDEYTEDPNTLSKKIKNFYRNNFGLSLDNLDDQLIIDAFRKSQNLTKAEETYLYQRMEEIGPTLDQHMGAINY